MAKPAQGILIFITTLRLLKISAAGSSVCVTNEEIPAPTNVEYFSIDAVPTIKWNFTSEEKFSEARFFVEFRGTFYVDWKTEHHCDNSSEKFCEIISTISTDETCPVSDYTTSYKGRVRAYLPGSNPVQCSEWAQTVEKLYVPFEDQLSPPRFEIVSKIENGKILVKNEPILVKHTNMSLNCYHNRDLTYEIQYWVADSFDETIQVKISRFSMRSVTFDSIEKPIKDSEVCVRMRTAHIAILSLASEWKTKCIVLEAVGARLSVVALTAIITVCAAILILLIILIAVKLNQVHKYVYRAKFEVPTELAEVINQPSTFTGANNLRITAKDVRVSYTVAGASSTESIGKECNTSEVVYLLSPEALKSPNFPRAQGTPKSLATGSDEESGESQLSDSESIPYVCSLQESEVRTERNEANRKYSSNQRMNSPHRFNRPSVQDNAFIDLAQLDSTLYQAFDKTCSPRSYESWRHCQKATSRYKTVHSQLRASENGLTETPEYDEIYSRCGSSLPNLVHAEQNYSNLTRIDHTQETCLENKIKCIKLNGHHSKLGAKVENISYHDEKSSKPVNDNLRRLTQKRDTTICLDNPTYNPKPKLFDFIDEGSRWTKTKSSPTTLYEDLKAGKITPLPSTQVHHSGKSYSQYQRRLQKNGRARRDFRLVTENTERHIAAEISPGRRTVDTLKLRPSKIAHSSSCESNKFSPARDRIVSDDSGYQMGSYSVSDECCSLSPPMTPDDPMSLDDFSNEDSRKINDVGDRLCRFQLRLETCNSFETQRRNQDCADYLKTRETSEITPYVSVESRIGSYVKDGIDQSAYIKVPGR